MRVVMKPVTGDAQAYLERAKDELTRVLAFRSDVVSAKVKGQRIILPIEINPKWDLPMSEKVESLKEWIPAKVRTIFKVSNVD